MLTARVFLRFKNLEARVEWLRIFDGELDEARRIAERAGVEGRVVYRRPDGIWEILRRRRRSAA